MRDLHGYLNGVDVSVRVAPKVSGLKGLARQMVRPIVTVQARFAAMHNKVVGLASAELAKDLQDLRRNDDMNRHASSDAAQNSVISDEMIDNFAIAGPASYVASD